MVLARLEEFGDVEAVGWVPERAGSLAVDEDDGGFVDGWVVVGVHAGAGAGDAWVGQTVGAEDWVFGWGVGGSGEGLAAFDFEEDWSPWGRGEGEVAGVDGFAGVVEGGWIGGPVGEGGFGLRLFGRGEVDLPVGA